jgi:4-amino-4-deoxy-L-arabinose transferase-like glycosyltransferase
MLNATNLWKLYGLGGALMLLALNFHPVGEEAIYPISTLEMWQQGIWFRQLLFGADVQHNPLLNWLMAPVAQLVGWTHTLVAARLVTIAATLGTGWVLAWLVWRLCRNRDLAAFAALCFLSFFDVLCYHGWLAYADPTFGFFIFSATALLWLAAREGQRKLLLLSALAISLAFLTKAQTAYVFYASAIFVLLWQKEARPFLLHPFNILILLLVFAFPFLWYAILPGGHAQGGRMASEIIAKLSGNGLLPYLRRLAGFPLEVLLGLFPAAWIALWVVLRQRARPLLSGPEWLRTGAWMALLMSLPYWLAPQGGVRYLIPVYPLMALLVAGVLWRAGKDWLLQAQRWIKFVLALQAVIFVALFPYYQSHYRGENYQLTAQEVSVIAQGQPLYSNDTTAAGMNLVLYLDVLRFPQSAVQLPPAQWADGYLLARHADPALGRLVKTYRLGADEIVLLCRGSACPGVEHKPAQ